MMTREEGQKIFRHWNGREENNKESLICFSYSFLIYILHPRAKES